MIVESINRSTPVTIPHENEEMLTGIFKLPIREPVKVRKLGLVGDTIVDQQVHGGVDQAVYIYHAEDYAWWSSQLGRKVDYGAFGENLTLSGLDESDWVIGDRLTVNDLVLEITAPRIPCFKLGVRMEDAAFVKKFVRACRPGAYARVMNEGMIQTGDRVDIEKTDGDYPSVKDVFSLWHSKVKPVSELRRALDSPIASVHRQRIQGWHDGAGD